MTGQQDDHRYAVDIRVFVSVIVIAMAVSFGVGVGLGPSANTPVMSQQQQQQQQQQKQQSSLPPVTSVEMNLAEDALAAKAASYNGELHEPAGQVRFWLIYFN
jgi:hypothetical protein